ncbi:MAG: sterol desaturase family protein [Bdellovibrionales bacterium]|nr:sterol desaturase family protein [Bdellovibrionales bacterium]
MNETPSVAQYILWYVLSYALIAGAAYLATTRFLTRFFADRRLRGAADPTQIRAEIARSTVAILVYVGMTFLTAFLYFRGHTRIYAVVAEYGWFWYAASFFVFVALHDTYFYWTHRWMHLPGILRRFHGAHHASVDPTPFTAHSFHFVEAVIQATFFVAVAVLVPFHWSAFLLLYAYSTAVNVYGHVGYDVLGRHRDCGPLAYFNHPSSHAWHHAHGEGNYGLYFNLWDRAMGTYRGHLDQ